jgi:hypothetical protein
VAHFGQGIVAIRRHALGGTHRCCGQRNFGQRLAHATVLGLGGDVAQADHAHQVLLSVHDGQAADLALHHIVQHVVHRFILIAP